ncbi:MAG: Hpt domain-containing protein, partial [Leptospiraceae bacterium]|nr:Hpt domain-containing protein [Leptospiraceae bacterium]
MSGILGEYTEVFLEESEDQIEELNANLLRFEQDYTNKEIINDIFRAAHSFKGSAAFVGLYNLSELAHKMENLLQKVREDKISVNLTLVNLLFECFDLIKEVIDALGQGHIIDTPFTEMIQKLEDYEKTQFVQSNQIKEKSFDVPKKEPKSSPIVENLSTSKTPHETATTTPVQSEPAVNYTSFIELSQEEELQLSQKENDLKASAFDIQIILKPDTPMKGSRYALILQSLKEVGTVFKSIPNEEELFKGGNVPELKFIFLTQVDEELIRKIISSDLIESLNIKHRNGKAHKKFG